MVKFKQQTKLSFFYLLIAFLLSAVIVIDSVGAKQFKITKVVQLVNGSGQSPIGGSIRWSPDGSRIGFFWDGTFKTVDTTGSVDSVAFFPKVWIREWEWVSDSEVAIHTYYDSTTQVRIDHLNLVSIPTRKIEVLESNRYEVVTDKTYNLLASRYTQLRVGEQVATGPVFSGPYRDLNGQAYIIHDETNVWNEKEFKRVHSRFFPSKDQEQLSIISIGQDAIYLINGDRSDSLRISQQLYKPYSGLMQDLQVSRNSEYLSAASVLVYLPTDEHIPLDTLYHTKPPGTAACDVFGFGFNPVYNEALFVRYCDNGHDSGTADIAVVDLDKKQTSLLHDIPSAFAVSDPQFAPDGLKIAYLSRSSIYIIHRKVIQ